MQSPSPFGRGVGVRESRTQSATERDRTSAATEFRLSLPQSTKVGLRGSARLLNPELVHAYERVGVFILKNLPLAQAGSSPIIRIAKLYSRSTCVAMSNPGNEATMQKLEE